jgi:glycosyltransferase involved in cell wall biosynthesis
MANLIVALGRRHDVRVLCVRASSEPPLDAEVAASCVAAEEFVRDGAAAGMGRWRRKARSLRRALRGIPSWASHCRVPALAARVRAVVREWRPEVVQFEFHVMGQYKAVCGNGSFASVLTQYEPGTSAACERVRSARGLSLAPAILEALSWWRYEQRVLRGMDAVVVLTTRDAGATSRTAPRVRVEQIPLGVVVPPRPLDTAGRVPAQVLYFGNFAHPPNVDAAVRLVNAIAPRVRARIPEVAIVLAGEAPPPELRSLADASVSVTGEVPSMEPYLDAAAVVAVPLRQGGGMRVKVLEAFAAGKAVVATRLALEGIGVVDGEHVLVADDDESFADAVVSLLHDPSRRARIGAAAREWATHAQSWDAVAERYSALYDGLLAGGEQPG